MDLLIRRAKLLDNDERLLDVAIEDGKISKIASDIVGRSEEEIDAAGRLVLPTFVEPHVHLDKALLAQRMRESASITEARQLIKEAKRNFTVEDVKERVQKILPWALENGVTAIRTHVDVDPYARLASIEALVELKRKYAGLLDIQIVAFPQEGTARDPSSLELLGKAIDMGADLVGGLPEAEATLEDSRKQIDQVMQLALERNIDIDMHCDVLPNKNAIEYYASQLIEKKGLLGKATADHLIALSYYDPDYASKIIEIIRKAQLNVVSNPCTMMTAGSLDRPPKGRGVTLIKELIRAGVNVAYGLDNIVDPYNPFGDFSPLSNGWLFAYAGQLNRMEEIHEVLRASTYNSAKILRLEGYGLGPGFRADLNILDASDPREGLRTHRRPTHVVKGGKLIVENRMETIRRYDL